MSPGKITGTKGYIDMVFLGAHKKKQGWVPALNLLNYKLIIV